MISLWRWRRSERLSRLCCSVLLITVSGCFPFASRGPKPLAVHMLGSSEQNGGGNAVVVRIYELSGRTNFDRAQALSFWRGDSAALGPELVGRREVTVLPDDRQTVTITPSEKAQFIGAAADFINPDADGWHRIIPIRSFKDRQVTIKIGTSQLSISNTPQ